MKKYMVISLFFLKSILGMTQDNTIDFVFPDNVETVLDSCLNRFEAINSNYRFYFLLEKNAECYCITIAKYTGDDERNLLKWVKQTNRFAVVNKRTIPVFFDYDLKWGAIDQNRGEFNKRDDNV